MKTGKAAGLHKCVTEYLKSGSTSVIVWLKRLLNLCFVTNMVLVDCTSVCVVSLYKVKGYKYMCSF